MTGLGASISRPISRTFQKAALSSRKMRRIEISLAIELPRLDHRTIICLAAMLLALLAGLATPWVVLYILMF